MTIQVETEDHQQTAEFLSKKIVEFNRQHWGKTQKHPLSVCYRNEQNQILAGGSGATFGNWLMIERLWVDDSLRGQGIGQQLLDAMEQEAKSRNCQFAFLDTLEFQAKGFYEKNGYQVQAEQEHYPLTGSRYYLMKIL